jgi:predicted RND superfamily exporter protein
MKIKIEESYAIVSTTISGINNKEMRQMHELKNRIEDVLKSHLPESKEKKYISDDDLKLMGAILSVFTKEYACTQTSAFDDFLKEQKAMSTAAPVEEEKPQPKVPIGDDQLFG